MRHLLDQARLDYDVIVVDAPPLLPVTDAALIAAEADGAVVVVRQGKTTRDQLATSMARLKAVGAQPLGVTLMLFEQRGMHRIEAEVYGFNAPAQRVFERAGFVCEGVRRRAYDRAGEWQDSICFGLLVDEFTH